MHDSGQGNCELAQGRQTHPHHQGTFELDPNANEEPVGHAARCRLVAKVHRSDAGHAADGQHSGNRGGHAGVRIIIVFSEFKCLISYRPLSMTKHRMSKEMMRAGIIEEMLEETMESVEDTEELEEEAQVEVDKVCELSDL